MADRLAFGFTTSGLTSNNSQDKHVLNCTRQSVQYRAPARACCSYKLHGPIPYSSFSNSAVLARVLIMYVLKHRQTTNRRTSSYLLTFEKKVHTPAEARLTSLNTLSGTETLFQGQRHSFLVGGGCWGGGGVDWTCCVVLCCVFVVVEIRLDMVIWNKNHK
jgi:hypothetical protein